MTVKFLILEQKNMNLKIKLGNVHDTIKYLLIPELLTLYNKKKWISVTKKQQYISIGKPCDDASYLHSLGSKFLCI